MKIRKVGNPRKAEYRDFRKRVVSIAIQAILSGGRKPVRQAVLIIQINIHIRNDPRDRNRNPFIEHGKPRTQKLLIAPEFVDNKPSDPLPLLLWKQSRRPVKLGKNASPVDISSQKHRRVHHLCQPHIHKIILSKIDLRRASRSFDHNNIKPGGKGLIRPEDMGNQLSLHLVILGSRIIPQDPSVYNHLGSRMGSRF